MFTSAPSYLLTILALSPDVLAFSSRAMMGNGWLQAHRQSSLGASFLDELQSNIQIALSEALFKTPLKLPNLPSNSLATKTETLLAAIDQALLLGTPESEEAVRVQFKAIEASAPAPVDLLDDPAKSAALDGEWRLRYTVAAFGAPGSGGSAANDASPQVRGVQGSINATGIKVDTTGTGVITTQTFDLASSRVANDIVTPNGPLGLEVRLQVAGPYQRSAESAQRADVRFDSLSVGIGSSPTFTVKWLFDLVYFFRNDDGAKSWLETTHVSENLRLGRGNKGSIFILTR